MIRSSHLLPLLVLLALPVISIAKRSAPKPVPPVTKNSILYSAPNNNGRVAYVTASDANTGKALWKLTIFETKIKPDLEEDVQWVFITRLWLDGNSLLIQDEKARRYRVDLTTKTVARARCYWFFCKSSRRGASDLA